MFRKGIHFEIVEGERNGISLSGRRQRKKTVLLRVGRSSISLRAFKLGMLLIACQILDGVLTYIGLRMYGVHMEGNQFLREMMFAYGTFPVLFFAKTFAMVVVAILTVLSHERFWIRPLIAGVAGVYLILAVVPWTIITSGHAGLEVSQALVPSAPR